MWEEEDERLLRMCYPGLCGARRTWAAGKESQESRKTERDCFLFNSQSVSVLTRGTKPGVFTLLTSMSTEVKGIRAAKATMNMFQISGLQMT